LVGSELRIDVYVMVGARDLHVTIFLRGMMELKREMGRDMGRRVGRKVGRERMRGRRKLMVRVMITSIHESLIREEWLEQSLLDTEEG
jgi:hypothetical protein